MGKKQVRATIIAAIAASAAALALSCGPADAQSAAKRAQDARGHASTAVKIAQAAPQIVASLRSGAQILGACSYAKRRLSVMARQDDQAHDAASVLDRDIQNCCTHAADAFAASAIAEALKPWNVNPKISVFKGSERRIVEKVIEYLEDRANDEVQTVIGAIADSSRHALNGLERACVPIMAFRKIAP